MLRFLFVVKKIGRIRNEQLGEQLRTDSLEIHFRCADEK